MAAGYSRGRVRVGAWLVTATRAVTEEDFRGGVHATVGTLVAVCAAYNAMRWVGTHARRHLVNALLYGSLWGYEVYQTHRHWGSRA